MTGGTVGVEDSVAAALSARSDDRSARAAMARKARLNPAARIPLVRRLVDARSSAAAGSPTLDELGVSRGLDQSSLVHDYLHTYERVLSEKRPSRVVIISGRMPRETGEVFAQRFPDTDITVISVTDEPLGEESVPCPRLRVRVARNFRALHRQLTRLPAPDVIIEDGTNKKSHKLDCLRHFFLLLADQGLYLIEDLHASFVEHLDDGAVEDVWAHVSRLLAVKTCPEPKRRELGSHDEVERARAIGDVTHFGRLLMIRKVGDHLLNTRDTEIDGILAGRRRSARCEVLVRRPTFTFQAASDAWENRPNARARFARDIEVPDLFLRAYDDVLCAPLQLAVMDDVILPNSYHLPSAGVLRNRAVQDCGQGFARFDSPPVDAPCVDEPLYHLDSWLPGHFGHIMTEDWGRLWGWEHAKRMHPGIKVLISADDSGGVKPFRRELLSAFGITADEILCIDSPVRAKRLIAASPMFHNHRYVDPAVDDIWRAVGAALEASPREHSGPTVRRIFVGRPAQGERTCHNADEVEQLFATEGFVIVRPETLGLAEQARLFRNAEVVAGYGGSGTFSAMYGSPRAMIVLASESYYTTNEWLIAAAKGARYYHFWCSPDIPQPEGSWDPRAFKSDFAFDFDRDGAQLSSLLAEL